MTLEQLLERLRDMHSNAKHATAKEWQAELVGDLAELIRDLEREQLLGGEVPLAKRS